MSATETITKTPLTHVVLMDTDIVDSAKDATTLAAEWMEPAVDWTDADEERVMMDAYVADAERWRAALQEIVSVDLPKMSAGWCLQRIAAKALGVA